MGAHDWRTCTSCRQDLCDCTDAAWAGDRTVIPQLQAHPAPEASAEGLTLPSAPDVALFLTPVHDAGLAASEAC